MDNVCRLPARHPMVSGPPRLARPPACPGGAAGLPCCSRQAEGLARLLDCPAVCVQVKQLQHEERVRLQQVTQQAPQASGALPTVSLPGPALAAAVL